jgi:hypothetical protein
MMRDVYRTCSSYRTVLHNTGEYGVASEDFDPVVLSETTFPTQVHCNLECEFFIKGLEQL